MGSLERVRLGLSHSSFRTLALGQPAVPRECCEPGVKRLLVPDAHVNSPLSGHRWSPGILCTALVGTAADVVMGTGRDVGCG